MLRFSLLPAALALLAPAVLAGTTPSPGDMALLDGWSAWLLEPGTEGVPFSFRYNGESSEDLLRQWPVEKTTRQLDGARTETTWTWTDPATRLIVRCVAVTYVDFPAMEWTVYLRNAGQADTPLVEDLLGLDAQWCGEPGADFVLHHAVGSPCAPQDYMPLTTPLEAGGSLRIGAAGGRPTNSDLAYFNIENGRQGTVAAVGWPGQWSALFNRQGAEGLKVTAGQEQTRLRLPPGEEIRTPLMALLFWEGDWLRGQNLWRRWMVAHNLPRPRGQLPPLPLLAACSSHQYAEMIHADEDSQKTFIDRYLEEGIGLDYWWMDAGWYWNDGTWPNTGTWEVDTKRFPRGLRAVSDYAHDRNVDTIVWFEPERVTPGTWLYDQHPEWLLKASDVPSLEGLLVRRRAAADPDPCVTHNPTDREIRGHGVVWEPGRIALHPGPKGEYAVLRFHAPETGRYTLSGAFLGIAEHTTTDVHILLNGRPLFEAGINLADAKDRQAFQAEADIASGDTLDFVVGYGNGTHTGDTTGLEVEVRSASGTSFRPSDELPLRDQTNSPWSCGFLAPGASPGVATFEPFEHLVVSPATDQRLLNLGNPEALDWLTNHVDNLLTEQGIDLYRQDFNIDPLPFWRAGDSPDHQGLTENRYVQGYLAYWDELRRRHPGMLIDSCASGGRRNDLETLRRAVPLLRSDWLFEPDSQQCHTYGISFWYPFSGTGVPQPIDAYHFRSVMGPHLIMCYDMRRDDLDFEPVREWVRQWREVAAPNYFGDYYPLTAYSLDKDVWIAWQFDRPEEGKGVIQAYRRAEAVEKRIRLRLHGLEEGATYLLTDVDSGEKQEARGGDLMTEGLAVRIDSQPGAAILSYGRL